jgi:hypothetical protein
MNWWVSSSNDFGVGGEEFLDSVMAIFCGSPCTMKDLMFSFYLRELLCCPIEH